jgi:hypothetical protein
LQPQAGFIFAFKLTRHIQQGTVEELPMDACLGNLIDNAIAVIKRDDSARKPVQPLVEPTDQTVLTRLTQNELPKMRADQKILQAAKATNEKLRKEEMERAVLAAAGALADDPDFD